MEIRLVTVNEDFEKAYKILLQQKYPLSFYEFVLKHDQFEKKSTAKLIGVFDGDECIGHLSYVITKCPHLDRILDIKEINQTSLKSYNAMMNFIDILAQEEKCRAIKISKKEVSRLNNGLFDRLENKLKALLH